MKTVHKTWTDKTIAEIASGTIREGTIRVLTTRVKHALQGGRAKITAGEACAIMEAIEEYRPHVSAKQAGKGAAWLYAQAFTPCGAMRRTENGRKLAPYASKIREAQELGCAWFRLVSFDLAGPRGEYPVPRYAMLRGQGAGSIAFSYSYGSWQSGIGLDVQP